jgi:hypothetical protein
MRALAVRNLSLGKMLKIPIKEKMMQEIIKKTFGGLSAQYYIRQLFFGFLFAALIVYVVISGGKPIQFSMIALLVINTLLYPYSRFVYESVVGFIMGNNVFFVNAIFMIVMKIFTMMLCWSFAIFIAPIGLAYLYYHHSKAAS